MASVSNDVRNYFKLELLLTRSNVILRQLFKNRYSQFNGGKIWIDTPACGKSYFNGIISRNNRINLTAVQKVSISNGDSNDWDLTTLATLLINGDRPKTLNAAQLQQLDQEDKLVKQLKDIRNKLAHHASKSIVDVEFNQLWTDLRSILLAFGDDDSELDKIKDGSMFEALTQSINEENVKEALRLNSLGTQAHKDGKFSEAISLFIKATVLPGVADRDRAIFFSNMSSSRLALYEQGMNPSEKFEIDGSSDQRYRALQDAKQARNLWSTWWKGHLRVGKVYAALNEHEKAINSFERALALDPINNDIQKALDDSRDIHSRQLRRDHLDPRLTPKTMSEQLNELQRRLGTDPEEVRRAHRSLEKFDPVGADVVKGHKYEHGDIDVKQDYEQAARYFAKAAGQGNAEGLYNLARLTDLGLGVKKDHNTAFKLFEQAAAQPTQHPILKSVRNPGVAEAEHALGLRYDEGIVVYKNLPMAARWYQRAVDHGSAPSANNLGLMYQNGIGVEKNLDKAQQLFELAARGGDPNALLSLAWLFLVKDDLQLATIWYDRACDAGNIIAQTEHDKFKKILQEKQQLLGQFSPNTLKKLNTSTKNVLDSIKKIGTVYKQSDRSDLYDYKLLNGHANRGSTTARKMCTALEHFYKALSVLMQTETLTHDQENTFVHELSQCYRMEHIVAQIPVEMRQQIDEIVDRVLHRCSQKLNAVVSQLDEDARVCYAVLHMDSFELVAQFLDQCKQKYPKSIFFFELSSAVYGWLKRYEASLYDANIGLELRPNCCELLYHKAVALRLICKDMDQTIHAYRAFLAVAPKDHRKVPESYYAMATCYSLRDRHRDVIDIIKEIYTQGEEAEKIQLPCFLPYISNSKTLLKCGLDTQSLLDTQTNPLTDRKLRLTNSHRIELITQHREWESSALQNKKNPKLILLPSSEKPRVKQQTAKSLIDLKLITLRELNPTKDHVYDGYALSVTIIEETYSWTPSIHLMIEDEHLDCERMCIYNFPEGQGEYLTSKVFTIGSKMHIINPYLRLGANDMKSLIRIDDFSSIIMQNESERVINMCRCCGEANASHVCSKCKRAHNCTKECQTMDWKTYKHKLICKSQ